MLVRVCVYVFIIDLYHHIGNFKEVFFGSWQHKKIHIETFFSLCKQTPRKLRNVELTREREITKNLHKFYLNFFFYSSKCEN